MASYDHLLAEQPWSFRPAFPDTWISDLFTMENESLAKALQTSISGGESHGSAISSGMLQSMYSKAEVTPVHTPTVSGVTESEAIVSKQQQQQQRRRVPPISGGRVAKRKARPSKRAATTTFYAADPENFMRMVQEVTGVRIGGASGRTASASEAVSRPEPRRAVDGFPTLDTSAAFMLDGSASSLVSTPYAAAADGGAVEHYYDSLCSFPTLESWEAV